MESLKMLQTEFYRHLHSKGFAIQRGVEQEPGAKKRHLDTREFKQQQEALSSLQAESVELVRDALAFVKRGVLREQEAALQERLQSYAAQIQEAEKILQDEADIPEEAIFALAPTLERMKKHGFDITELVEKLYEKGIPVKAPTLAKYLNEFRRGKGKKAEGKTDTPRRQR